MACSACVMDLGLVLNVKRSIAVSGNLVLASRPVSTWLLWAAGFGPLYRQSVQYHQTTGAIESGNPIIAPGRQKTERRLEEQQAVSH